MAQVSHGLGEFVETKYRCFAVAFVDKREGAVQCSERVIVSVQNDLTFRQRRRRVSRTPGVFTHR